MEPGEHQIPGDDNNNETRGCQSVMATVNPSTGATSSEAPAASTRPVGTVSDAAGGADEQSVTSSTSELECPICYHTYCEPVRAACDRHIFCRHCLWKMQHPSEPLRCPICRAAGPPNAANLEEVADLAAHLRARDPTAYDERAAAAQAEREKESRRRSREMKTRHNEVWHFEVCGAGCEESNGVYVADVLPTYLGPTVYRKPNTFFFIFRWHRTQWVIAELRDQSRMGNDRTWLYSAPTQSPPQIPPATGWEIPRRSHGQLPAPEVRFVIQESTRNWNTVAWGSALGDNDHSATQPAAEISVPALESEEVPVRCFRCAPPCSIM